SVLMQLRYRSNSGLSIVSAVQFQAALNNPIRRGGL
ncbi:MAG: hypothetical protein ACI9SC_002910, partial [Gammaproteobacteria bacterium]